MDNLDYHCKEITIIDFIYPAEHSDDVHALLDKCCESEDEYWVIKRDTQDVISISKETFSRPFPNEYEKEEVASDPIMQEKLALINSPCTLSVYVYLGFDDVVYRPEELYRLVEMFLSVPLRYVWDCYLWTWIEIVRGFSFDGRRFLDFYNQYYGGDPYLDFSTENSRNKAHKSRISITDNIIEDWYKGGLSELKTFSDSGKPEVGIARWGTTTIPVESISQFRDIIKNSTSIHFINVSKEKISLLLDFLDTAEKEGKPVIVYGV